MKSYCIHLIINSLYTCSLNTFLIFICCLYYNASCELEWKSICMYCNINIVWKKKRRVLHCTSTKLIFISLLSDRWQVHRIWILCICIIRIKVQESLSLRRIIEWVQHTGEGKQKQFYQMIHWPIWMILLGLVTPKQ